MSVFVPAQRRLFATSAPSSQAQGRSTKASRKYSSSYSSLSSLSSVSGELNIACTRSVTPECEWPDYTVLAFHREHLATQEPLTRSINDQNTEQEDLSLPADEEEEEEKTMKSIIISYAKMFVPHFVLLAMLLSYLSLGAFVLTWFEAGREMKTYRDKITVLKRNYGKIIDETWKMRQMGNVTKADWKSLMESRLYDLSVIHGGAAFVEQHRTHPHVQSHWTFPTALLNSLTLLSACGYGEVMPLTDIGQLFAVAFTLSGIPLMFITAADIGKFLSEVLLLIVDVAKSVNMRLHKLFKTKKAQLAEQQQNDELFDEFFNRAPEMLQTLWMPIFIYVSVISAYCTLGSFMFRTWQPQWSFMHAFHFGFNVIVTVGLGDLVVSSPIFLCLLVSFVIVGLSVVTMCVDLASTHLKAYFMRIHYFGRPQKFLEMTEDIKQMMDYLTWMKRKRGGSLTWQDVRDLMESIRNGSYNPRVAAKWKWIDETLSSQTSLHTSVMSTSSYTGRTYSRSSLIRPSLVGIPSATTRLMRSSLKERHRELYRKDLTPFSEENEFEFGMAESDMTAATGTGSGTADGTNTVTVTVTES